MRNDFAPRVLLLVLVLLDSALAVHVLRLGAAAGFNETGLRPGGLAASFAESGLRPGGMVPVAFGLDCDWALCLVPPRPPSAWPPDWPPTPSPWTDGPCLRSPSASGPAPAW